MAKARLFGAAPRMITVLGVNVDHAGFLVSIATSCPAAGQAEAGMHGTASRMVTELGPQVDHAGLFVFSACEGVSSRQPPVGMTGACWRLAQPGHRESAIIRMQERHILVSEKSLLRSGSLIAMMSDQIS